MDFSETATVGRNVVEYKDTGLSGGTSYTYRVRAYNAMGTSGYSNSASTVTAADFSGNWSGSVSDNHGSGTLVLGLIQSGEIVGGRYAVRNAATGQTSAGSVSGRVSGLFLTGTGTGGYGSCVQTLSFTAQISDTVLSGTYSGIDSCAGSITDGRFTLTKGTLPAAPSHLVATTVSVSQVNLIWRDNSTNENGFRIERCTGAGCTSFAELTPVGANVTSYQNIGLAAGTSYSYRVRAYNAGGNSGYSNTATATTMSSTGAGRIAFVSDRNGNPEIYVMNADGFRAGLVARW
jgi:Fibronectin type III domain